MAYLEGTKSWVQSPVLDKLGILAHTYNSSMQAREAGGSGVRDHPWLCNRFEASLSYIIQCLNRIREEVGWKRSWSSEAGEDTKESITRGCLCTCTAQDGLCTESVLLARSEAEEVKACCTTQGNAT